jgi:hypothetical protein
MHTKYYLHVYLNQKGSAITCEKAPARAWVEHDFIRSTLQR